MLQARSIYSDHCSIVIGSVLQVCVLNKGILWLGDHVDGNLVLIQAGLLKLVFLISILVLFLLQLLTDCLYEPQGVLLHHYSRVCDHMVMAEGGLLGTGGYLIGDVQINFSFFLDQNEDQRSEFGIAKA